MAQSKKNTKEKKTPKSSKKTTSKKAAASKKTISNSSFNAIAALIIMGLITVIIILVNSIYFGKKKYISFNKNNVKIVKAQDLIANRNGVEEKKSGLNNNKKINVENEIPKNNKKENIQVIKKSNESQSKQKIKLYFVKLNNNSEKIYLSSVRRDVNRDSSLKDTLNKLIEGPTPMEKKKGLLTAIPAGLRIKNIIVRNRTAEINFNEAIENSGNGDILIKRIDQIVYTATQFNNIDSVLFKINGKRKKTLGSDGLSISGPMHRRK